ncbi:MAG: hypothetical protein ACOCM4_14340 [Acetivibrio ethanolgignens]
MIFQGKIDRAFKHFTEKHGEEEERREQDLSEMPLEKGDLFAMILSAFIVIVPVALVVLAVLGVIGYFFFFH